MKEEKKRILQMIQDGEITADEALELIEELDRASRVSEIKEKELVHELSTVAHEKANDTKKEHVFFKKNVQLSKDKLFDFVENAVKKIKQSDLDFNFGNAFEISHIFHHDKAYLQEINIDIANGKTKIIPWDNNDIRIECEAKVYKAETQDEAREAFLKETNFTIKDGKLGFHIPQKTIKSDTVVYIPKLQYKDIYLRMFNGSISAGELEVENFHAKTANGAIALEGINGDKLDVETGNGNISIRQVHVEKIEAESLNGTIQVEGIYKNLDAQSFSSPVTCSVADASCEYLSAKSVTGKVQVYLPAGIAVDGELKSNLGRFNVSLDGIQIIEEKSEVIQKVLKFKTIRQEVANLHLFADTKTGAISVS